jgi:hypothetical protein
MVTSRMSRLDFATPYDAAQRMFFIAPNALGVQFATS